MTVAEVAREAQISPRQVLRDIQAGILPARKAPTGRWHIRPRDVRRYRHQHRLQGRSWTVDEYARLVGFSRRTIRRRINTGDLKPVRVSQRRLRITEAEHRRFLGVPIDALADAVHRSRRPTHARSTDHVRRRPNHTDTDEGVVLPHLVTVAELAALAKKTVAVVLARLRRAPSRASTSCSAARGPRC